MTVYLNACSHGAPPAAVHDRLAEHAALERTLGEPAARARVAAEEARVFDLAARFIGADPGTVALAPSTTAAWLPFAADLVRPGQRVLVAPHEWWANLRHLRRLADLAGARIEVLPNLEAGDTNAEAWGARLDEDVSAICTPMVTSIEGRRYPVEAIGALPRPEGCRYAVDVAQALGQQVVDVRRIRADLVVGTCRKWLRAPRGTALRWAAPSMGADVPDIATEPPDMTIAHRLALGVALDEAMRIGVPAIAARVAELRARAEAALGALGLSPVPGALPTTGALAIELAPGQAGRLKHAFAERGIVVKFPDPARDEPEAGLPPRVLRIAPHIYNGAEDIEALARAVREAL